MPEPPDRRPHSRACGFLVHPHGPDCAVGCPTCAGRPAPEPMPEPTNQVEVENPNHQHQWGDPYGCSYGPVTCAVCGFEAPRNVAGLDGDLSELRPAGLREDRG